MTRDEDRSPPAGVPAVARHVLVAGRVQGVFFRVSTRREARRHGIVGWVRNRRDGRVDAHLQGPPDGVEAVLDWMRAGGPSGAWVGEVAVEPATPIDAESFDIVR